MSTLEPATLALFVVLALSACSKPPAANVDAGNRIALKPLAGEPGPEKRRQLVYVPVNSSIHWGFDDQLVDLAVTLSIRNVSSKDAILVRSVKYFDASGQLVREYIDRPGFLDPMSTVDIVIQRRDRTGGTAASFVVDWSSAADIDDPVIGAVMVGQQGNAGISFTSSGRPLPQAASTLPR